MSKNTKDELGSRMKENYENRAKTALLRRTPVAIRIDGKAFHTFTRNFDKPFDRLLMTVMQGTMKYLCENIPGCVLGYTQSDEITLILTDYKRLSSNAWFDYEVQKMSSIAASMATMAFNKFFAKNVSDFYKNSKGSPYDIDLGAIYEKAIDKGAMFDARCFNIPKEEVTNLVYWRQQDASKNSVQMVARAYFSHKELQNKNTSQMQEMLFTLKGVNWNDYPTDCKRGSCCVKVDYFEPSEDGKDVRYPEGCSDPYEDNEVEYGTWKTRWVVDKDIPIFKGEGRDYIESRITFKEED